MKTLAEIAGIPAEEIRMQLRRLNQEIEFIHRFRKDHRAMPDSQLTVLCVDFDLGKKYAGLGVATALTGLLTNSPRMVAKGTLFLTTSIVSPFGFLLQDAMCCYRDGFNETFKK